MTFNFFNDDEISRMRSDVANMMPGTAYILRMTPGAGLYGGYTGSVGTAGTVSVRLDRLSRQDSQGIIADAEVGKTYYRVTLPYNADLRDGDDLEVNSVVFRVLQVSHAQSADIFTRAVVATKDEGN